MLTENQIQFLNRVCKDKWVEENSIINVEDDIHIPDINLTEIPVQFGQVAGIFDCRYNKLTTLKGAPSIVKGFFTCDGNKLQTLVGGPKEVEEWYSCEGNLLTNLIGSPNVNNGDFWCRFNKLTSLEGCSSLINGDIICTYNENLEYLWGLNCVKNVYYYNYNEINEWIIELIRQNIIFPYSTLEENIKWIKITGQYSCLFTAPEEILKHFSSYIINGIKNNIC